MDPASELRTGPPLATPPATRPARMLGVALGVLGSVLATLSLGPAHAWRSDRRWGRNRAVPHRRRLRFVRTRDRYAQRLRRIPELDDLTLSEARVVASLVDDVVVDGRRLLTFGTREAEALTAAIPRLAPRLRSWPLHGS